MKRLLPFCALGLLILPLASSAEMWDWEIFMSMHTVRSLVRLGDDLWGATDGGLFRFNLPAESFETFTTADGLADLSVRALTPDSRGNLILAMGNTYVDVFSLSTRQVTHFAEFHGNIFQINALLHDADTIYVCTDIGVSKMFYRPDWQQYEIKSTYSSLGDFTPEIPATCVQIFNGGLWVGTEEGLARGDLNSVNLQAPQDWINYTMVTGLSDNSVLALTVFDSTLYTATSVGLCRLENGQFQALNINFTSGITFLKVMEDTLYYGRVGGIFRLEGDVSVRLGGIHAKGLTLESAADGTLWAGMQIENNRFGGLRKYAQSESGSLDWLYYAADGPQVNVVSDILVLPDGRFWVGGSQEQALGVGTNGALSHFNGQRWSSLTKQNDAYSLGSSVTPDSFFWYGVRSMSLDHSDGLWAGSDGRGASWFRFVEDTLIGPSPVDTLLLNGSYSAVSGRLLGTATAPNYAVVRDLLTDNSGNIWLCNSEGDPEDGLPIALVPEAYIQDTVASPEWFYLTIPGEVYAEFQVDVIMQDTFGRKWFGASNNKGRGIRILDDHGTLDDLTDDSWTALLVPQLPSDSITALACDNEGVVWVGTPGGVKYFYPAEDPEALEGVDLLLPISQSVRAIGVDPQNNKWFGTITGVSVLAADNFTWLANFTTLDGDYPSPLPGDVVQAIAFDAPRGYAYLGTDKGLARLETPYMETGTELTLVIAYPNPFPIPVTGGEFMHLKSEYLDSQTELKIFTASGLLVRHLKSIIEIGTGWDGLNMNGELVGTGIYLLLAYSADGSSSLGKVAVIHQ